MLSFHILLLLTTSTKTELLELEQNLANLNFHCDPDYSAIIRADPDNADLNCITFSNTTEGGDIFCGSCTSSTGLFEICFDYFGIIKFYILIDTSLGKKLLRDEDSGGFIGL